MKMFLKCLAVIFVSGAALFVAAPAADAANVGSNKIVPLTQWKCTLCGLNFYTFAPEDVSGSGYNEHKDGNYQQKNWVVFASGGQPIPKCGKDASSNGGHFFDKNTVVRNVSPKETYDLAKDKKLVVLKSRGSSLSVRIRTWENPFTKQKGYCFDNDGMDMAAPIDPTAASNVYRMTTGERIADMNALGSGDRRLKFNMIYYTSSQETLRGIDLSEKAGYLWFSN
jgi:hypothetical protein